MSSGGASSIDLAGHSSRPSSEGGDDVEVTWVSPSGAPGVAAAGGAGAAAAAAPAKARTATQPTAAAVLLISYPGTWYVFV